MRCKYCGKKLAEDVKNCERCGKEVGKELTYLEKVEREVKIIGTTIYILGWFEIVINLIMYSVPYFEGSVTTYVPNLTGLLFEIVLAILFIILGNRIKNVYDINIRKYLIILLVATIFVYIMPWSNSNIVGMFPLAYLVYALYAYNIYKRDNEYKGLLKVQSFKIKKSIWILISILLLPLTWLTLRYDISNTYIEITPENIKKQVQIIKGSNDFPMVIDEVTVCTDITVEGEVVQYHLERSNPNGQVITKESLKKSIIDTRCSDKDTSFILDSGIAMEYQYTIKETGEEFLIPLSSEDCK